MFASCGRCFNGFRSLVNGVVLHAEMQGVAESNGVDKDMILRLEQWLQLQTLEMAKVTGQALECHIWLHT